MGQVLFVSSLLCIWYGAGAGSGSAHEIVRRELDVPGGISASLFEV